MRSIPLITATTVILLGLGACGGDGGGTGVDPKPTASFTGGPCTVGVACTFADNSSDPQGNNTITTRSWDFNGDGTEDLGGNVTTPTFTYTTAGTFQAKLTVTDDGGNTDDVVVPITVNPGQSNNVAPVASFDLPACVANTPCGFHSTSTDADGSIATTAWDFGDGQTGDGVDVTHTFASATTFTVTLTVTDNLGATGTTTQQVTVQQPTGLNCTTAGKIADCVLTVTQRATLKFVMVSESCDFGGNSIAVIPPAVATRQNIFLDLCGRAPGEEKTLSTSTGTPLVLEAGTQVTVRFTQGEPDPTDPPAGDAGARIVGQYPNWTLDIDDGGNINAPGEPDFNDAVIQVVATPAP